MSEPLHSLQNIPSVNRTELFGIKFNNLFFTEVLDYITFLIDKKIKTVAFTPNVDHVVKVRKDSEFMQAYNSSDLVLNDSKVLFFASRLLKKPLKDKISGSDILPALCRIASLKKYSVFFIGGSKDSASRTALLFRNRYRGIDIVGTLSPDFGFENNSTKNNSIISEINKLKPDILFVGLGAPKQEKWIIKHKGLLDATFIIGIGASFEFASGIIKRSPAWMQNIGLEWFYRLLKEPKRLWKRYLIGNSVFLYLLLKELLKTLFFKQKHQP